MTCRQLMLSTALLLFVAKTVLCLPVGDDVHHGGLINVPGDNEQPQCVQFSNHYCNQFENRSMAYFPNPRGHKTLAEAEKEFADFIPLLQSGCHQKLGTLLCFIYFPFCESSYPSLRVYPCREVCDEVNSSSCTTLINQYAGWNDQLQCNLSLYMPKSSMQCADGVAPVYPGSPTMPTEAPTTLAENSTEPEAEVDECAEGTHDCDVNAKCTNTDGNYTCTCRAGYSGDGRTCTVVCGSEACPSECDYRENANSGTFKRNAYCYAARVTVKSYKAQDCQHAYTVEVKDQFDLQTPYNSSHSTKAPAMGDSAIILTSPSHCTKCPKLEVSKTYLIAGSYSRAADGSVQWKLDGIDDKALVSEWISKYDRKLGNFISGGNSNRKDGSKFSQECEKNSQMVSAGQWINH